MTPQSAPTSPYSATATLSRIPTGATRAAISSTKALAPTTDSDRPTLRNPHHRFHRPTNPRTATSTPTPPFSTPTFRPSHRTNPRLASSNLCLRFADPASSPDPPTANDWPPDLLRHSDAPQAPPRRSLPPPPPNAEAGLKRAQLSQELEKMFADHNRRAPRAQPEGEDAADASRPTPQPPKVRLRPPRTLNNAHKSPRDYDRSSVVSTDV